MISFFKSLGRGILYVVGLPFLLAFVAIYAVFAFFIIAFMFFKAVVLFFMGRSLFDELDEDKKAKEVLSNIANRNQPQVVTYTNNQMPNQNYQQINNYPPQNDNVSQYNNNQNNNQHNYPNEPINSSNVEQTNTPLYNSEHNVIEDNNHDNLDYKESDKLNVNDESVGDDDE